MMSCSYQPCQKTRDSARKDLDTTYDLISPLCHAFGPFNISFTIAGIFPNYDGSMISGIWCWKVAYSACVICLLVLATGRWILSAVYERNVTFGVDLFLKILLINWGIESTAHYAGCAITFACSVRLPEFFKAWQRLRTPRSRALNCIRKNSWLYVTIALGFVITDLGLFAYAQIWSPQAAKFISPVPVSTPLAHAIIPITIIAAAYMAFAWVAPSLLMNLISHSLTQEFITNSDNLKDLDHSDPTTFAKAIRYVRVRHQKISNLVHKADRIFSLHIAFNFMGSIIAVCLMVYNLIWDPNANYIHIFAGSFWVIGSLGKIILDCVTGAKLNNAVCYSPQISITYIAGKNR